jgi:DNA-binding CsgD family transcriptional regulator
MEGALLDALCGAFDHLAGGFVAASSHGRILFANASAREMMDAGRPIRIQDGFLQGEDRKSTELLLRGLRQAAELGPGSLAAGGCLDICLRDGERGASVATLRPLPRPDPAGGGGSIVAVAVKRIEAFDCGGDLTGVAQCFGLTQAELKTLQHVLRGGDAAGAADAFNVSKNTVKSHLQNIFSKTRSPRQPRLFKLINDLRPPLRSLPPSGAAEPR